MSAAKKPRPVVQTALRWPEEVARSVGVSADLLQAHGVAAELKMVQLGRVKLVPVEELRRWLRENARVLLDAERGRNHANGRPR